SLIDSTTHYLRMCRRICKGPLIVLWLAGVPHGLPRLSRSCWHATTQGGFSPLPGVGCKYGVDRGRHHTTQKAESSSRGRSGTAQPSTFVGRGPCSPAAFCPTRIRHSRGSA